ncbi:Crp/Fnr family transcriptional regulator [Intestinimonas sp.]|uniref:Crp/Fnr family transcriptional regulator n=2 Tax=Intestinimonas TaxID=1392389 RepID=UPI002601E9E1|nr:Crp/Fnr family transcriptional regulator [Intestinimonas sp.]
MDVFNILPPQKRDRMERLFQNCTEDVKYYMTLTEIEADQTFIKAGTDCTHIFIVLSGKVTGVEWPVDARAYPFKDFGPGDFFGEIECFAGLEHYRISIVSSTRCQVLSIPVSCYMDWMRMDVEALFLRTQENISSLIAQTAEARKYLFLEGKDRLMTHLIRKFEQRQPLPAALELKKTRSQLADEIGFSIKTLNRSVGKLAELGLIQLRRGKIVISREGYQQMKLYVEQQVNGRNFTGYHSTEQEE